MPFVRSKYLCLAVGLVLLTIAVINLSSQLLINASRIHVNQAVAGAANNSSIKLKRAEKLLKDAARLAGSAQSMHEAQAQIYHLQGNYALATTAWLAARTASDDLLTWAKRYRESGQFDEALVWLHYTIEVAPDDAEAYFWTGYIRNLLGSPELAISVLQKGIELSPANRDLWYELGISYRHLEKYRAALDAFEAGRLAHESYGSAGTSNLLYEMADVYWRDLESPDEEMALDLYSLAIEIDDFPMQPWQKADAHYQRGIIFYRLGQTASARTAYESALALNPEAYAVHLSYARLLNELGQTEEALASLDNAIQLNPHRSEAIILAGDISYWSGKLKEAEQYYTLAITLTPNNQDIMERLTELNEGDG